MDDELVLKTEKIIRLKQMNVSSSELIEFWEQQISRLFSKSQCHEEPHEQYSQLQDHHEE